MTSLNNYTSAQKCWWIATCLLIVGSPFVKLLTQMCLIWNSSRNLNKDLNTCCIIVKSIFCWLSTKDLHILIYKNLFKQFNDGSYCIMGMFRFMDGCGCFGWILECTGGVRLIVLCGYLCIFPFWTNINMLNNVVSYSNTHF